MQKQAPTLGRLLVMVGFALSCFGLLLFLWLAFGGPIPLQPKGYRVNISFPSATQLAQEADVRISGVPVGKVKTITPSGGRSLATIELEEKFSPLPSDAQAILRQKTLLGETYVELTPGEANAKPLPEGKTLPLGQVSNTVELDEIFQTFQPETRAQFQNWMETQAQAVTGRGMDISDALGNLAPFETDTTQLLKVLNRQQGAVQGLISNTGVVFGALTERGDQLANLITNSNRVFETTADRNAQLQQIFTVLPTFERESRQTIARLDQFAENTNPLVTELRPAAAELSPTLQQLELLAPDLQNLFADIDPLVNAGKKGLPAVDTVLKDIQPLLGQFDPFLRQINPALYGLVNYRKELSAFFSNGTAATQATDRPPKAAGTVHYLRTANPINPEALAVYDERIGTNRPNPYQLPGAFNQLASGLPIYENRQCGRGIPAITTDTETLINGILTPISQIIPPPVMTEIQEYVFGALNNPDTPLAALAPPCNQQPKFPPVGGTGSQGSTTYPQVYADPPGQTPINQPPRLDANGAPIPEEH